MSDGASIPIPRELLLEACAAGVSRVLKESGLVSELADAQRVLHELRMIREGLLTAEQAAGMLGISVRTFKRQVAAGLWPEIRIMGNQEYRYPYRTMAALMKQRNYKRAAGEDDLPENGDDQQKAA